MCFGCEVLFSALVGIISNNVLVKTGNYIPVRPPTMKKIAIFCFAFLLLSILSFSQTSLRIDSLPDGSNIGKWVYIRKDANGFSYTPITKDGSDDFLIHVLPYNQCRYERIPFIFASNSLSTDRIKVDLINLEWFWYIYLNGNLSPVKKGTFDSPPLTNPINL